MARAINRLTARGVTTIKAPGRHADGAGLYLRVDPSHAKRWVFVFQWAGARKEMGLGPLHDVSLADARDARDRARKLVREGINPIEDRRRAKASDVTFGGLAEQLIAQLKPGWKNPKTAEQWSNTLTTHAAKLVPMDVASIRTEDVLEALKPIWGEKPETAGRVRNRIEAVLDAAKARGLRAGENPARWKGHMDKLLPKRARLSRGHHKAMPYHDLPAFMARLGKQGGEAARMLQFVILTACRTGEARGATWREVQGDVWTVPAERMKAGRVHRVPLTAAALAIIPNRSLPVNLVFTTNGKPLSAMAMDMLLRRMDCPYTVHGFRSTFRDWAGDATEFPRELAEAALAHQVGDEVERAYRRSDALARRRKLMDAWADFCTTQPQHGGDQPASAPPPSGE
jgi:integrase